MKNAPTRLAFSLLLAALGSCAGADDDEGSIQGAPGGEPPPGRLVIVGGGLQRDNAEVYEAIVAGRLGEGPLCVLPTASADPAASMESAREALATYAGPDAVEGIPLSTEDPGQARVPAVVAALESCSGFYFTGGVQSRVVDVFLPGGDTTEAYRAVRQRWLQGAVVAGSSAGAAMMSRVMIASGGSGEAVANGVATEEDGEGVHIRGGMGFFDRAMLDQHFLARGRIGRLLVATLATDSLSLGLGIDENTALVVDGDTAWVTGASAVVVVDAREARRTGPTGGTGIRVILAGAGDALDLRTFEVRTGAAKTVVEGTDSGVAAPGDPFARWAFLHLLVGLASSPDPQAETSTGGVTLTVSKAEGFGAAMAAEDGGVEGTPAGFSAGPFRVDLVVDGL